MVLEYVSTFTPEIIQICRFLYTSTMEHLGLENQTGRAGKSTH
jgi:hypothetical protein